MQFVLWSYFPEDFDMVNYTDGTAAYSTDKSPDLNAKSLEILSKLFNDNDIEPKTD